MSPHREQRESANPTRRNCGEWACPHSEQCGNGACLPCRSFRAKAGAVAAFDMEPSCLELSRALGLAEAKAVNRSARHRSPRLCRVHRSLVRFFSSGCFSFWRWFIWNISALSRFTEEGRHSLNDEARYELELRLVKGDGLEKRETERLNALVQLAEEGHQKAKIEVAYLSKGWIAAWHAADPPPAPKSGMRQLTIPHITAPETSCDRESMSDPDCLATCPSESGCPPISPSATSSDLSSGGSRYARPQTR